MVRAKQLPAEALPVAVVHPEVLDATRQQLVNAAFSVANYNTAFKEQLRDDTHFTLGDGARVDDYENPGIVASTEYSFLAHRVRSGKLSRPAVFFAFSIANRLHNVPLPSHLSGLWSAEGGLSAVHEARLRFRLNMGDRSLKVDSTYGYYESDSELLSGRSALMAITDPSEDFTEMEHLFTDPFEFMHKEEAEQLGQIMPDMGEAFDGSYDNEQYNIALAFGVLARIKRALFIQAGVPDVGRISLRDVASLQAG